MKSMSSGIKTPAFAAVPRGMIRVGPIQGLPGLLATRGVAVASIVEAAGLSPAVFEDADAALPVALLGGLLVRCAAATKDPNFGLHLGQLATASSIGVDGFIVQNSPDVGTALRNLERHVAMHDHAGTVSVTVDGDGAALGYELLDRDVAGATHILAGAMAIGCNLMRALCGDTWAPQAVQFAFRKPVDVTAYRHFFRAPVRFDAEACALLFPAATLGQSVVGADAALYRLLAREVQDVGATSDAPIGERVARLVRRALASGEVTAERVAGLLAVHPRTLNRRLKSQGTTFHKVVDEVRFAMAREMLGGTDANLVDIAVCLGYADASAFARAFRRWTGVAPSAWRRAPAAA